MNINVWTGFSKRKNSTKQPTGGTQITVRLKQNCSVEAPVFILDKGLPDYDYVQAFGHYYFVSDIVSLSADLCEIHCSQDVLATYKTDIGNTTAFVMYDTASNSDIVDQRLSQVATPTTQTNTTIFHDQFSSNVGSVVVTIAGTNQAKSYIVSVNNYPGLLPNIISQVDSLFPTPTDSWADFIPALKSTIMQLVGSGNLPNNIMDVRWLPFHLSGGSAETIYNGMYNTGVTGYPISIVVPGRTLSSTKTVNIPWQFSDWRNTEPYTQIYCCIPYVGVVSYPASALKGHTSITFHSVVDQITGDLCIHVYSGDVELGLYGAQTSAKIALGNSSPNIGNIVTSLSNAIGAAARGDIMGEINNGVQMYSAISQTVGGVTSAVGGITNASIYLTTICHNTNVTPSSVASSIGTPTFTQKQISSCPSGYIKCKDASVETTAKDADKDRINMYLNSGFFYE